MDVGTLRRGMRHLTIAIGVVPLMAATTLLGPPAAATPTVSPDRAESANTATPFFDEQVLFTPAGSGYSCFRIPTVVQSKAGTLLAFAEGRRSSCSDTGDIDLVLRRSHDGGETWGDLQVLIDGNGETRGNPTPVVDQQSGRISVLSMRNPGDSWTPRTPYLQYSDDDGASWSTPRDIGAEISKPEWAYWYATGPVHGIQLARGDHRGRLIAPVYFSEEPEATDARGAGLIYSDDGGLHWQLGATVRFDFDEDIVGESTVVELTDGTVYVSARKNNQTQGHRMFGTSSDGGESFDGPFELDSQLISPINQASLLRWSAVDQGDDRNRLLFASPAHPAAREVMTVRSSYDEAKTWDSWKTGKVIWWGPSSYSDLTKINNELIGLAYEAGGYSPYETIRFARFNEAYLATPNGDPPGIPDPPLAGPTTADRSREDSTAYVRGGAASISTGNGKFRQALHLDGVDDRIELPMTPALDLGAGDFTWTMKFRYDSPAGSHALMWAYRIGPGTTPAVWLRAEPGSSRIRAGLTTGYGASIISSAGAYNDGDWHDIALQRKHGTFSMIIDGDVVAEGSAPFGSVTEGAEFGIQGIHIGQRIDGANRFVGDVDEAQIYRRALSAREIEKVNKTGIASPEDLSLRLSMDEITPEGGA